MKIVISNGGFKFHLAPAAAELADMQLLDAFITAGYPTNTFKKFFNKNTKQPALKRLFDREETIPDHLIYSQWVSELVIQSGIKLSHLFKTNLCDISENLAMKLYASSAKKIIKKTKADIYHYRAGYGHNSVKEAKKKGMITICDHSIAHPALIDYFIKNNGQYPDQNCITGINKYWQDILKDIEQADHILVNSQFVKDTMIFMGMSHDKIHVIYLGVDDNFLNSIPNRQPIAETPSSQPIKLLYAGGIIPRKGFSILAHALESIRESNWRLEVAGSGEESYLDTFKSIRNNNNVKFLGNLSRKKLAEVMVKADIFIFPSFAEGSARVIFEALAAGCYIITTPNSGSIVENNVHGALIKPGDIGSLAKSIENAINNKKLINEIGQQNRALVHSSYSQREYGNNLHKLYKQLILNKK